MSAKYRQILRNALIPGIFLGIMIGILIYFFNYSDGLGTTPVPEYSPYVENEVLVDFELEKFKIRDVNDPVSMRSRTSYNLVTTHQ
jgi:hypothetical protein